MLAKKIFKISELTAFTRRYLENTFEAIFVEGEITNLTFSPSGHCYFTLKDSKAQVKAVLFKSFLPNFLITNGANVLVTASVSLYEPRGDFQLIVHHIKLLGAGIYYEQFLFLKNKLAKQGWFDQANKRPITFTKTLGLITSPQSAVIKDLLSTLKIAIKIFIYPVLTQGKEATKQLIQAINLANQRNECELLILARGGGSTEDLSAFNDEQLAQVIRFSNIPIISAVGHETDFTIADFVADYRVPTPTAAAELIMQKYQNINANLSRIAKMLVLKTKLQLENHQQKINLLAHRLKNPYQIITQQWQRLQNLNNLLKQKILRYFLQQQNKIYLLNTKLTALNPTHPLQRGFSLLFNPQNNQIISKINQLKKQPTLKIKLQDGECIVRLSFLDKN